MDRAQKMIEKAVEARPNDGYIVDSLGWAYYLRGMFAAAVEQLEQAVVLVSDDPTINDHLGDAYWRVGRRLEAHYQWQRALDLSTDDGQAEAIRKKIEDGLPPFHSQ
jgi:tetratricopeptide (TPR) repeat protein